MGKPTFPSVSSPPRNPSKGQKTCEIQHSFLLYSPEISSVTGPRAQLQKGLKILFFLFTFPILPQGKELSALPTFTLTVQKVIKNHKVPSQPHLFQPLDWSQGTQQNIYLLTSFPVTPCTLQAPRAGGWASCELGRAGKSLRGTQSPGGHRASPLPAPDGWHSGF